jgi:hypothetical protein
MSQTEMVGSDCIKSWPENERPREKLLARGAGYLTDAELLSVVLRIGQGAPHRGMPKANALAAGATPDSNHYEGEFKNGEFQGRQMT